MLRKNIWLRNAPLVMGGLVIVVVSAGLIVFIKSMMAQPPATKKLVQQISIIQPPPPPKIEKPPEPVVTEEVKLDDPTPTPEDAPDPLADDAAAGDDLALDAEGVAGGDGFGLLGKKDGRDLIGSNGSAFGWYASSIQSDILDYLSDLNDVRKQRYSVVVGLWIDRSGRIIRFELLGSSGDRALDESLKTALTSFDRMRDKPPDELPQPIRVRITSRI